VPEPNDKQSKQETRQELIGMHLEEQSANKRETSLLGGKSTRPKLKRVTVVRPRGSGWKPERPERPSRISPVNEGRAVPYQSALSHNQSAWG